MGQRQGGFSVTRMCALLEVCRADYYRRWQASGPAEEEMAPRGRLQELALAHRHYGYRRLGPLLRREGWAVNHKRVLRLLREDNLLSLRRKAVGPATTDSRHGRTVWPNLARWLVPTTANQLWVADITYVRLVEAFAYLAAIAGACSRRVIGWAPRGVSAASAPRTGSPPLAMMADHLRAELALAALRMAIGCREVVAGGLVRQSDRGIQCACGEYLQLLAAYQIRPSMSRPGCPYDNAPPRAFARVPFRDRIDGAATDPWTMSSRLKRPSIVKIAL